MSFPPEMQKSLVYSSASDWSPAYSEHECKATDSSHSSWEQNPFSRAIFSRSFYWSSPLTADIRSTHRPICNNCSLQEQLLHHVSPFACASLSYESSSVNILYLLKVQLKLPWSIILWISLVLLFGSSARWDGNIYPTYQLFFFVSHPATQLTESIEFDLVLLLCLSVPINCEHGEGKEMNPLVYNMSEWYLPQWTHFALWSLCRTIYWPLVVYLYSCKINCVPVMFTWVINVSLYSHCNIDISPVHTANSLWPSSRRVTVITLGKWFFNCHKHMQLKCYLDEQDTRWVDVERKRVSREIYSPLNCCRVNLISLVVEKHLLYFDRHSPDTRSLLLVTARHFENLTCFSFSSTKDY